MKKKEIHFVNISCGTLEVHLSLLKLLLHSQTISSAIDNDAARFKFLYRQTCSLEFWQMFCSVGSTMSWESSQWLSIQDGE